ncbi:MAG: peptide ABC transporter permease, partial [Bdellovibrionia bacterium]
MPVYLFRRLMMMVPTLFGITIIVFVIINLAPGGPIEQRLQAIRFGGGIRGGEGSGAAGAKGSQGVTQEVLDALKKQYGFDKPLHVRYGIWLKNIVTLDFGDSFTHEEPVTNLIVSKFPVSLQFGIISLFLTYLLCIPLGILKAIKDGSLFDITSG